MVEGRRVILSLDGGGVRAVFQLRMLYAISKFLWNFKIDLLAEVDLVAGSGTGGIFAALLALRDIPQPETGENAHLVYLENLVSFAEDILHKISGHKKQTRNWKRGLSKLLGLGVPPEKKHRTPKDLRNHLVEENIMQFWEEAETTLLENYQQKGRKAAIVTNDITEGHRLHVFRNYPSGAYEGSMNVTVIDAIKATSATPPHLPEMEINGHKYLDGGTVANNPVEVAFFEASALWPGEVKVVISVGSGVPTEDADPHNIIKFVGGSLVNLLNSCEVIERRFLITLSAFSLNPTYIRLNPPEVGDIWITEPDHKKLEFGIAMTRRYIHSPEFRHKMDLLRVALQPTPPI